MNKQIYDLLLTTDHTCRTSCPTCGSKAATLCITREGSVVKWHCHRASCTEQGTRRITKLSEGLSLEREGEARPKPRISLQRSVELYEKMYGTNYEERIVKDEKGNKQGVILRKLDRQSPAPKDYNIINPDWIGLHFPSPFYGDTIMLVEDIPSANKMNEFFPCAALLGVHLSEEKLDYLLKLGVKRAILALDNDATRQALRLSRRYIISTEVLALQRDLKDEPEERLKDMAEAL